MHNFFQDSNADYSMSRLCQFLAVGGGIILTGMALYFGRDGADIIFSATAAAAGAVSWNNRTQERMENVPETATQASKVSVDSAPGDVKIST